MNTYEFHGSIRIEADSEDEAVDIFHLILKDFDTHINDVEEL